MLTITPNAAQLREVERLCAETGKNLPAQIFRATKDTGRGLATRVSKDIRSQVNIKAGDMKKHIATKFGSPANPFASVTLSGGRIPLKHFGARQTKKGVSYKISKVGKSRQSVPSAFGPNIPRLGGHVFKRVSEKRFPITKLFGPSPPAVAERAKLDTVWQHDTLAEFTKKIDQRIAYLLTVRGGSAN